MAPELNNKQYYGWELKKSDIWSIGILSYMLVVGYAPFHGIINIMRQDLSFPHPDLIYLTENCKQFITKLLIKNPKDRYSASDALKDPWIDQANQTASNKEFGQTYQKNIESFDECMCI